ADIATLLRQRPRRRCGAGDPDRTVRGRHAGGLWIVPAHMLSVLRSWHISSARWSDAGKPDASAWRALDRCPFPYRCVGRLLSRGYRVGRPRSKLVRARLRATRRSAVTGTSVLSRIFGRHESRRARRRCFYIPGVVGVHVVVLVGAGDGAPPRSG